LAAALLLVTRAAPASPLFPYTTLFRSLQLIVDLRPLRLDLFFLGRELVVRAAGHERDGCCEQHESSSARRESSGHVHHSNSSRRSEEHTSELQSLTNRVCRLLLDKSKG